MNALVGYTGFVGSNLFAAGHFDAAYHSQNITQAYGTCPDLLVYAGLRAEKYLADYEPEKDLALIRQAEENILRIRPEKLVLISTIDVWKDSRGVNEETVVSMEGLCPYGLHRYQLEQWVRENYQDALIIRLPGLFGKNIKKNFIYDVMHLIPSMLKEEKMNQLAMDDPKLRLYYDIQDNGFYKVKSLTQDEKENLKKRFINVGFSALNFTDSRSKFQFYNLNRLWDDMQTVLRAGLKLWHPATEPVIAGELFTYLTGKVYANELDGLPADYGFQTLYAELFGGNEGYISSGQQIKEEIKEFVRQESLCL